MKKNHRRLWAGVLVCLCLRITIRASAMQMGGFDIDVGNGENYYWQWQEEQQWNGNNQENTWENSSQEPEQPKDFQGNWQNNLPDHSGVSDQITENGYPNGTYDTSGGSREENGYSQWSSDAQWNSGETQRNKEIQWDNNYQWNNNDQWTTGYQWGETDFSRNSGNQSMNENAAAGGQAESCQEESQQTLSRMPERTQNSETVNTPEPTTTPKPTTVPESSDVRKKTDSEAEKKNQGAKNEDKKNKDKRNKEQKNKEEKKKEKRNQENQEKKNRNKKNNQTKSKDKDSRNRTSNKTGEGDRTGKTDKTETKNLGNANSGRAGKQKNSAKYIHVKDESVEFQHQNGNEKSQTPSIRIISEGSVQILSLRINGAECSWHWKGDWVVPDEESKTVKNKKGNENNYSGNTLELLVVSQGGKLIKKTY